MKSLALSRWLLVVLWMGVIFWFSSQEQLISPTYPIIGQIISAFGHVIFFGVLYFLFVKALKSSYLLSAGSLVRLGLTFVFLYGLIDEFHQSFVPGRDASMIDVALDVLGGVIVSNKGKALKKLKALPLK